MRMYVTGRGRVGVGCGCLPFLVVVAVAMAAVSAVGSTGLWWLIGGVFGLLFVAWVCAEVRNFWRR
jgi:FtsH-binding integral membrane protein